MGYDDLAAFLDQIHDRFGRDLNSLHLFWECVSKGISAQGDDNPFFLFIFHSDLTPFAPVSLLPAVFADNPYQFLEKKSAGHGVHLKLRLTESNIKTRSGPAAQS